MRRSLIVEPRMYAKRIITEWATDEVLTLVDYEVDDEDESYQESATNC